MVKTDAIFTPHPKRWIILFAVMAAGIMGPIDGSVVNVALPTMADYFNVRLNEVGWVSMAYLLVLGSLILTYGRLGDMYGFRKILLLGIVFFTISSLFCSIATNIWILVAARVVQAIGAGMFMAMGPAIITSVFPPYERGRALGTNGMIIAIGLALGPTLGGFLVTMFGWQSIFLINIPIGIISFILCRKVVPETKDLKPQHFDLIGALLGILSLGAFLLICSYGGEWGWTSTITRILSLIFIICAVLFIFWERKVKQPMLDLDLFKNKVFSAANLAGLLNFMSQSAMIFLLPFYMQQVLHFSPKDIGLILTVSPLLFLLLAPISGTLSDRLGTRWLAFTGQVLICVALFLMSELMVTSKIIDIVWRLAIFGTGIGIFQSPNNSAVMGSVPRNRLGIGSGVLATNRNVGMVLGVAISSGIFTWQSTIQYQALGPDGATVAFMNGLKTAFLVSTFLAIIGAIASLVRGET
ncbi:MAG: hypothetical protein PWP31_1326 [Clostridia bacterium]|nr:hypothetical protein [Clostridia bacterium]